MRKLYGEWGEWASKQFPEQTSLGKVNHLEKEVRELKESIENGEADIMEIVDCVGLLFSICHKENICFERFYDALNKKLHVNKHREWGAQNDDGSFSHVKK